MQKNPAEIDLDRIEAGQEPVGGWDEWAKHQRPVSKEKEEAIEKALFPEGRPWSPIRYLQGLHTRQLMALRKRLYAVNSWAQYSKGPGYYVEDDKLTYAINDNPATEITLGQLKRELAGRPHVPNKAEAKALRKAKAHAQRNR